MSVCNKINFGRTWGLNGLSDNMPADIGRILNFEISKIWLFCSFLTIFCSCFDHFRIFFQNDILGAKCLLEHKKWLSWPFLAPQCGLYLFFDDFWCFKNLSFSTKLWVFHCFPVLFSWSRHFVLIITWNDFFGGILKNKCRWNKKLKILEQKSSPTLKFMDLVQMRRT